MVSREVVFREPTDPHTKALFEDNFPLPQVGYLSFLGGVNTKTKSFNGISRGSTHLSLVDTTPGQCAWNFLDRKSIDRSRVQKLPLKRPQSREKPVVFQW